MGAKDRKKLCNRWGSTEWGDFAKALPPEAAYNYWVCGCGWVNEPYPSAGFPQRRICSRYKGWDYICEKPFASAAKVRNCDCFGKERPKTTGERQVAQANAAAPKAKPKKKKKKKKKSKTDKKVHFEDEVEPKPGPMLTEVCRENASLKRRLQRYEAIARGDEPEEDELFEEPLPMETTTTESELQDAKGEWKSRRAVTDGLQARLDVMLKAEADGHGEPEDAAKIADYRLRIASYWDEGAKYTPKGVLIKKARQAHSACKNAQKSKDTELQGTQAALAQQQEAAEKARVAVLDLTSKIVVLQAEATEAQQKTEAAKKHLDELNPPKPKEPAASTEGKSTFDDSWNAPPETDVRNMLNMLKQYLGFAGADTVTRHIGDENLCGQMFVGLENMVTECEHRRARPTEDYIVPNAKSIELALYELHTAQLADSFTAADFETEDNEVDQEPAAKEKRKAILKQTAESSMKKAQAVVKNAFVAKHRTYSEKAKATPSASSTP